MKKLCIVLLLFFSCVLHLNGMTAPAEKQTPSTLPKILHKIAYSERVGKFCSWFFKPATQCCKNERLRSWFKKAPLESKDPIVTLTEVHETTSTGVSRIKKSVAIISIGFLLLCNLPQAGAFVNNLQDFAKPKVCFENDAMKRCCTIEDNVRISCCTTDKMLGIEVCKDYLIEMPETASIPFQDLSRMKDQCSADLTPETRAIRQEFDEAALTIKNFREELEKRGFKREDTISKHMDTYIFLPATKVKGWDNFLKKIQKSLDAIGYPQDVPLLIKILQPNPHPIDIIELDASISVYSIRSLNEQCHRFPFTLKLSHNNFEYLSVDEIFATIHHELGHLVSQLRVLAQLQPFDEPQSSYDLYDNNFARYIEETSADLVGNLLSQPNTFQTMFLRQHVALQEQNSRFQQKDSMSCIPDGTRSYPPYVCRVAYAKNIQNQLGDLSGHPGTQQSRFFDFFHTLIFHIFGTNKYFKRQA